MYQKLKVLCKERGTTVTQLCIQATGNSGNLATWKKGYMRSDYLLKVSDILNVSVDYLLGRTDNPNGYSISNIDTTINGTQAHIINNNVSDNDLYDIKNSLGQLSKTDKHRAIADILDLLEKKYEKKAL